MSIITVRKKPLLLKNFRIDLAGSEHPLVIMNLETSDKKKMTIGVPPNIAFSMLEELSIFTLGVTKREKTDTETMYR